MLKDRFQATSAFCEGLLHPSVTEDGERSCQKRLLQVLFCAPSVVLVGAGQIISQFGYVPGAVAGLALTVALSLAAAVVLTSTGRRRMVEIMGLCIGSAGVAMLIALGGGLGSALTVLLAGLVIEAAWVARGRRAMAWGLAAAVVAAMLSVAIDSFLPQTVEPSAWSWLTPLFYGLLVAVRFPVTEGAEIPEESPAGSADAVAVAAGAIILRLHASGDVLSATAQAKAAMGIEPEILLGTGFFERVLVSDRVAYLSAVADVRDGKGVKGLRLRVRVPAAAGAGYRAFLADMALDADGEIAVVLRDDDATSQLEQALADAKREAKEAVELRDHLLASVSHELKTPLNAIAGFSDVLANEMFGPFANAKQREYVTLINEASSHLLNVVNAVLDVSKMRAGTYEEEIEEFRLEEAAKLTLAIVSRDANARTTKLELDLDPRIGTIRCDRRALQQILINLLSNAVKFTPEGSVRLVARQRAQRLHLTVSDTGIGIAPDDLARLGKPFTQVKNEHASKGTGLGLSLVKGLVEASGGSMSIESAPGAGTKVHVSLPVSGGVIERTERTSGAKLSGEWNEVPYRKTA